MCLPPPLVLISIFCGYRVEILHLILPVTMPVVCTGLRHIVVVLVTVVASPMRNAMRGRVAEVDILVLRLGAYVLGFSSSDP